MCVCVYWNVAKLKIPITAEHRSNGISGTQRAQMAPKSLESFWKGHKNGRVPPPPVLIHPFTACYTLPRPGAARAFSPSSILWKLPYHFSFYVHNRERKRNVFEMSTSLTGSSLMKFWERSVSAALWGTTDGTRASCCSDRTGNKKGRMHMQRLTSKISH